MEEINTELQTGDSAAKKRRGLSEFMLDIIRGFAIGVALIIPGFSGGSIAAIVGIYEKLIDAISGILKNFKKSILTLLPLGTGAVMGIASLLFPLKWALAEFPFPTIALFIGLTLGSLPAITDKVKGRIKPSNVIACILPLVVAVGIAFLPVGKDVNLFEINFSGYLILVLIGVVCAAATVIPGISGSMLLLIFGYYNPLISMITDHLLHGKDILQCFLILGSCAIGVGVGFIVISTAMKYLLQKYPRGTYFAIIGFIVGSMPSAFISVMDEAGYTLSTLPTSPIYWIVSALLLIAGFIGAYSLVRYAKKHNLPD